MIKCLLFTILLILCSSCMDTDQLDQFVQNESAKLIRDQSTQVLHQRWFDAHVKALADLKIQQELAVYRQERFKDDLVSLYAVKQGVNDTTIAVRNFLNLCDSREFVEYFDVRNTLLDWPFANYSIPFETSMSMFGGDGASTIVSAIIGLFEAWSSQHDRDELSRISKKFNEKQILPDEFFSLSQSICHQEANAFFDAYVELKNSQNSIEESMSALIESSGVQKKLETVQKSPTEIAKNLEGEVPEFDFEISYQRLIDLAGTVGYRYKTLNGVKFSIDRINDFETLEKLVEEGDALAADLEILYPNRKVMIQSFRTKFHRTTEDLTKRKTIIK